MHCLLSEFDNSPSMVQKSFNSHHYKGFPQFNLDLHTHDYYELFLFISGDVTYQIEDKRYKLTKGNLLLIYPNQPHCPIFGDSTVKYERLLVCIKPSLIDSLSSSMTNLKECFTNNQIIKCSTEQFTIIRQLFSFILEDCNDTEFGFDLIYKANIAKLLTTIYRYQSLKSDKPVSKNIRNDLFINSVMDYINEHLEYDLKLEDLEKTFFMNKCQLLKLFKAYTGKTIHAYIRSKQLAKAKEMILQGLPITEVYLTCGFGDYSSFFRSFKSECGLTPKQYYKEALKELSVSKNA